MCTIIRARIYTCMLGTNYRHFTMEDSESAINFSCRELAVSGKLSLLPCTPFAGHQTEDIDLYLQSLLGDGQALV